MREVRLGEEGAGSKKASLEDEGRGSRSGQGQPDSTM